MTSSPLQSEERLMRLIPTAVTLNQTNVGGSVINFAHAGKGPPLILLHGLNMGWGIWYANIAALASHFSVFALDLPGCGKSTAIDFSKADLDKDFVTPIEQFIKRHRFERVHLMGHSFGGFIAAKVASRNSDILDKLILADPIGLSDHVTWREKPLALNLVSRLLASTVMRPTRANMKKFLLRAMRNHGELKEEFVDYFHDYVSRDRFAHPFHLMNRLLTPFRFKKEISILDDIADLKRPLLIIASALDPLILIEKMRPALKSLPHANVKIFTDSGHVPAIEKSAEFNDTVIEFLSYRIKKK